MIIVQMEHVNFNGYSKKIQKSQKNIIVFQGTGIVVLNLAVVHLTCIEPNWCSCDIAALNTTLL